MAHFAFFLISLLFFDIPLLYITSYWFNLRSLIICLSSGDIYLSLSISSSFATVSELFFAEVSESEVS